MSAVPSTLTLEQMSASLVEIYSALDEQGNFTIPLLGNIAGTRMYSNSSIWGRFWSYVYYIPTYLGADAIATDSFILTTKAIQKSFHIHLEAVKSSVKTYGQYMIKRTEGYAVDETEIHQTRDQLTNWNQRVTPFLKLLTTQPSAKISAIFRDLLLGKEKYTTHVAMINFFNQESIVNISSYQEIIDLEGHIGGPIPFATFLKISTGKELLKNEIQDVKLWVEKLNLATDYCIEDLQKVLTIIIQHFIHHHYHSGLTHKPSKVLLEHYLSHVGSTLFKQSDEKHLAWREALKTGDSISINGKLAILGARIGKKKDGDENIFFQIEGEKNVVLRTAKNRSLLGIEQSIEQEGVGIPKAKLLEVDNEGRYALVEKLFPLIDKGKFKNLSCELTVEQKVVVLNLIEMINDMIMHNYCLAELNKGYLMRSQDDMIKSTRHLTKCGFDYNQIERFVFNLHPNLPTVYRYIMQNSLLKNHALTIYYQAVFNHVVLGTPIDAADISEKNKIVGDIFKNDVESLKNNCTRQLEDEMEVEELSEEMEELLNLELVNQYHLHGSAAKLWPTLQSSVVQAIKINQNLLKA